MDAIVTAIDGDEIVGAYLDHPGEFRAWSHDPALAEALPVGSPFRLHTKGIAGCPAGWFSVYLTDDIVDVPPPPRNEMSKWREQMQPGILNAARGRGVPIDHQKTERDR